MWGAILGRFNNNDYLSPLKVSTTIPKGVEPTQISVPPSCAVAIVTYAHEIDAKQAFRALAYERFKNVPLYLEWAPNAAFRSVINPYPKNLEFI